MLSANSIVSELTVVTVPATVSEPSISTSPEKLPVVPSNDSVPPDRLDEIVPSTYVLFAASAPSTGAETFLMRFEFTSRWSPNVMSPVIALISPSSCSEPAENCRVPDVPGTTIFSVSSVSVVKLIEPLLSSITFLPLTYNEPGPT